MGLFDFGDKALIKSIANRVIIGVDQIEQELSRSGGVTTPIAKGIAYAIRKDINEMRSISSSLSESSRTSILIKVLDQNVQLDYFYLSLASISKNMNETNGISFWEFR